MRRRPSIRVLFGALLAVVMLLAAGLFSVALVEYHPVNREVLKQQLEMIGFVTDTAGDAAEALERYKRQRYGLVFTDIQLPGADGHELARSLRAMELRLGVARRPVIALTANALRGEQPPATSIACAGTPTGAPAPAAPSVLTPLPRPRVALSTRRVRGRTSPVWRPWSRRYGRRRASRRWSDGRRTGTDLFFV